MGSKIKIYSPETSQTLYITLTESTVKAGFPSPAEDHSELKLDLNKELIKNPSSTFFARVSGESMIDDGVDNGDLLVVDKSVLPYDGAMAVCYIDGEFTLKRVKIDKESVTLIPANSKFSPVKIDKGSDFQIWGVVRYLIKKM
ncbi:MAG: peptidase S24 [Bacteroidetes bacterium GWF2_41_61]|nr:MAG: peptidase S24 [Bacteroidetes bacterium GWE2_40_15]OFY27980.1 MAG: peptidase S24 [Bacteroidetes bacterium GWF2_41_61]OFY90593.1 MAG: peptidase S24 [Bacteroidetes bacterium RIFOXYA12_FULL_40_10]